MDGGNTPCVREPRTALETAYDNTSSTLGAENVQDAIDELAAWLPDRFYYSGDWLVYENPTVPNVTNSGDCRSGDIAVRVDCRWYSGGTGGPEPIPILVRSYAERQGDRDHWFCQWMTPGGEIPLGRFEARALCLDL